MTAEVLRKAPGCPKLAPRQVKALADQMLQALSLEDAELSVLLTSDAYIHKLNHSYRGKDKPTDVLSFPLDEDENAVVGELRHLGDVVISLETAARQARSRKRDLLTEVRFLLAHGLGHLLGHDHGTPAEKRKMDRLTRFLVRSAPISGPPAPGRPGRSQKGRTRRPR